MNTELRQYYSTGNLVNDDPVVVVFEEFVTSDEAKHLIHAGESQLTRAVVSEATEGVVSEGRTGRNCWINHHHDEVISRLCQRISALVDIPLHQAESLQLIHYNEGHEYAPHFDAWDAATDTGKRCMARGGQRLVTCLLYLNTIEDGGNTCFPKLDLEVRAIKGRMVIFHNCQPETNVRHPHTLHGGMKVISGEKWACNLWFREGEYQTVVQPPRRKSANTRVI